MTKKAKRTVTKKAKRTVTKKAKRTRAPKFIDHESTIGGLISDACSELQCLAEEMRSWADNLEEKFSATSKYEQVSEAADNLENIDEPTVPDVLENIVVNYSTVPPKRRQSRSDRRYSATHLLQVAIDKLDDIKDDEDAAQDLRDEADQFRGELDNILSEAENVEFPGMYG